jgi:hypothetical protein
MLLSADNNMVQNKTRKKKQLSLYGALALELILSEKGKWTISMYCI